MFLKKMTLILFMASTLLFGLEITVSKTKPEVIPIIKAIKVKNFKKFKKLFNKGKLLKRYSQNQTLLHYASRYNNKRVVMFLVQKGALLNALGGDYNATPLHTAIRYGYLQIAVYLIKSNASLNIRDSDNETVLDIARRLKYNNIIYLLKKRGAVGSKKSEEKQDSGGVNKYRNGMSVNKYKSDKSVNKYSSIIKSQKIQLRHNNMNSENEEKNNKVIGQKNSIIEIGN